VVRAYFAAFPRTGDPAVARFLTFPYCYWADAEVTTCQDAASFLAFRDTYMAKLGAPVTGEILALSMHEIGESDALVHLRTARLDAKGTPIAELQTGFLLYFRESAWLIGASIKGTYRPLDGKRTQ
jgi:hypothetical protein